MWFGSRMMRIMHIPNGVFEKLKHKSQRPLPHAPSQRTPQRVQGWTWTKQKEKERGRLSEGLLLLEQCL
jgi:hypothetical protein